MGRKKELQVLESLKTYHALLVEMRSTSMQMFTHPDATANQVMSVQMSLARSHAEYRESYGATKKILWGREPWSFDWGRYRL